MSVGRCEGAFHEAHYRPEVSFKSVARPRVCRRLCQAGALAYSVTRSGRVTARRALYWRQSPYTARVMAESSPHILVVDDHRDIRDSLSRYLVGHGYRVSAAADAGAARRQIRDAALDLVILDIMMPGEDGLSLCRWLRETTAIPVILLTAVAEETDRVIGLEMGADDYVTKPFSPRELLARVRAVLRRAASLPAQRDVVDDQIVRFDRWVFHVARQELEDETGLSVALSTGEFRLLLAFVRRPNRVLSREQLLDLTQGREAEVFDRSVDNQVSRLRRKIERDSTRPQLIKTVWGGGYRFTATVGGQ